MDGVIVVDKPAGRSSFDVVRVVRALPGVKKAGHTGTLDPLATGVLPVCLNEATKLVQFLSLDSKDYRCTMLLGVETDTLDVEGKVLTREEVKVGVRDVEEVLKGCTGEIEQVPPRYSALKYRGKTFYSLARKGIDVQPAPRRVEIRRIELLEVRLPYVTFLVSCSKGTYIRSLCADVGGRLGTKACLAGLRRLRSGSFHEEGALSVEDLRSRWPDDVACRLISMADALAGIPTVYVDGRYAVRLRRGHQPTVQDLNGNNMPSLAAGDVVKFVLESGELVAVGAALHDSGRRALLAPDERAVRIKRIFNG